MHAVALITALLACRPVDPAAVADRVLHGDLRAANSLLEGRDPPSDAQALAAELAAWQSLDSQRRELNRASRELLRERIEAGAAQAPDTPGASQVAAGQLAVAVRSWPEDPAFLQLAHDLGEAAERGPPDQAVRTWQALATILEHDPPRAEAWRQRAAQAALALAYQPEQLAQTRAAQAGVGQPAARHLLLRLDREYVDPPDWPRLVGSAARRLHWLAGTEGAQAAWPGIADLALPSPDVHSPDGGNGGVDAALGHLADAVTAGAAVGLPEEVVVAEWVAGALDALDPWTRAVWPAEIAAWQAHHAGVVVGVGVELDQDDAGEVFVARPLPGTSAWEAGIHQGDRLLRMSDATGSLQLDLQPTDDRLALARAGLLGPEGSQLHLDLRRAGAPVQATVLRESLVEETVRGHHRDDDDAWSPWLDEEAGIAYLRLLRFRPTTEADVDALLEPVLDRVGAVVLDLRGNPGGDVNAAVQVADRFVADGLLTQISGRVLPDTGPDVDPVTGAPLAEWNEAVPGHALEGVPVVVIVDQDTASAAEVLAGALAERAGATVVGTATWGKGRAQALRSEPELGYAVQFTNLVWTLPGGRRLERNGEGTGGIQPDLALAPASPGEDYVVAWLEAQRIALRRHADGSPMAPVGTPPRADLPPLAADPMLHAATLAARARLLRAAAP